MRDDRIGGLTLVRGIGLLGAALVVLNSVVGAGIFALPSEVAVRAGALSPWLFLACGLLVITIVLAWAELASYFRDSGGPVLYAGTAFGPLAGFTSGWLYFLSRMTAFAANANVLVIYLATMWSPLEGGFGRGVAIVAICGALVVANYLGVRDGVRTVGLLTVLKLAPLLLLVALGLPHVGGDVLLPDALAIADPGGTTLLLIYAYVGFEAATITAGETARPRRDLPRALLATVAATAALYFLIVLVYVAVLPGGGEARATLVDLGRELAGPAGAAAITAAAIFSIGGNLASNMLTVPRLTYALAEQRLLPAWFARVHPRFRTPGNSIVFLGVLATLFAVTGSFFWLAAASSLTRLIVYGLCIAALPVIRRRADAEARARAFRLRGGPVIPVVALALCAWVAFQSEPAAWRMTGLLLVGGLLLFALAARAARAREATRASGHPPGRS
ncbi:MAG TPA: APC family permease [Woeseiaceae bacterium]|nr:APC family permease [Woeseiaceae bacterium]